MLKLSRFQFQPGRTQPGLAVPQACSYRLTLPALVLTAPHSYQQPPGGEGVAPAPAAQTTATASTTAIAPTPATVPQISADAALVKSTPPLTEDALRARYVGKLIFLRGSYQGDDLNFDQNGKVNGSPTMG